jgi:hypothetical protein
MTSAWRCTIDVVSPILNRLKEIQLHILNQLSRMGHNIVSCNMRRSPKLLFDNEIERGSKNVLLH